MKKKVLVLLLVTSFILSGCVRYQQSIPNPISSPSERVLNVAGSGMEPTLKKGAVIQVLDLNDNSKRSLKRGDIVIYRYPRSHYNSDEEYRSDITPEHSGRVIGIPGDQIELKNREIYINSTLEDETYLSKKKSTNPDSETKWEIQDGEVFILGDNREYSIDSRASGPIKYNDIVSLFVKCVELCE